MYEHEFIRVIFDNRQDYFDEVIYEDDDLEDVINEDICMLWGLISMGDNKYRYKDGYTDEVYLLRHNPNTANEIFCMTLERIA